MQLTVQHFDVFARHAGGGNRCPVVTSAGHLSARQMQSIAARYGQECAFVVRTHPRTELRFFVPLQEMSMCVHGTIAAVTALIADGTLPGNATEVVTASGPVPVRWTSGSEPTVDVEQQQPHIGDRLDIAEAAARALATAPSSIALDADIRSVSVSRSKLLIPVVTASEVRDLAPDYGVLEQLCVDHAATGAYVFAPHHNGDRRHFVARQFPVGAGYDEDAATGVAAGALAAYQAHRRPGNPIAKWTTIVIDQGDTMGRPSRLIARAFSDFKGVHRSIVSGSARHTLTERLEPRLLDTV